MEKLFNKKIVFHVHTRFSCDSCLEPEFIVDTLFQKGILGVIITDHNTTAGAVEAQRYSKGKYGGQFFVIVGEEIKTDIGDIIGFPLKHSIKASNHMEVINQIKSQRGFVCLTHPYKGHDLSTIHGKELLKKMDFIETFNSRVSPELNAYAEKLLTISGARPIIGSDAHTPKELLNVVFSFDEQYNLNCFQKKYSGKRSIRQSQLIRYYREKKWKQILKYSVLFLLGK